MVFTQCQVSDTFRSLFVALPLIWLICLGLAVYIYNALLTWQ